LTAICAVRKYLPREECAYTVWACDSRICSGDEIFELSNSKKYCIFPRFTALYAGTNMAVQHCVYSLLNSKAKYLEMRGVEDANRFQSIVADKMYSVCADPPPEFDVIIVSDSGLFYPDPYGFCVESSRYVVAGSGGDICRAVLEYGYSKAHTKEELWDLAFDAVDTACKLRSDCGPPIVLKGE
jgi:20S proteasome alpha/beta subunit